MNKGIEDYLLDLGFRKSFLGDFYKETEKHDVFCNNDKITVYRRGNREHPLLNDWEFLSVSDIRRVVSALKIDIDTERGGTGDSEIVFDNDEEWDDLTTRNEKFFDVCINGSTAKWVVDVKGIANQEDQEISVCRDDFFHGKKSYGWFLDGLKVLIYSSARSFHEQTNPVLCEKEWNHQIRRASLIAKDLNSKQA